MKRLRLAFWQCNPTMGDFKGNEALLLEGLERARKNKADMIICPELAITGYPPEDLLLKKHFIDANEKALDRLRMKVGNEVLICGFVDRDNHTFLVIGLNKWVSAIVPSRSDGVQPRTRS